MNLSKNRNFTNPSNTGYANKNFKSTQYRLRSPIPAFLDGKTSDMEVGASLECG
jgi:hypothetical protein